MPVASIGVPCLATFRASFFFRTIGEKMSELWGVEVRLLPLTRLIAYTPACCYRTSRDYYSVRKLVLTVERNDTLKEKEIRVVRLLTGRRAEGVCVRVDTSSGYLLG